METVGQARTETFSGHPLAKLIRGRWADDLGQSALAARYRTKGSAGSGNWAEVVWASVFDRLVTDSATKGYYVCYLISPSGDQAVLALALGTTEVRERYGDRLYEQILRSNAGSDLGLLVDEDLTGLLTGPVSNGGSGPLARGYEAGTIVARVYQRDDLPTNEELRNDLARMLALYRALFNAKADIEPVEYESSGGTSGDSSSSEGGQNQRREKRRKRIHESAERNQSLSRAAKKLRGTTCEVPACGKSLSTIYGPLAEGLIEAHHVVPFSQLDDNVQLDPATDFRVVCPDCHRAIHQRRPEPYSLEEVSDAISKQRLPRSRKLDS